MEKLIVTGASGFVGRALVPKLIAKGKMVYALSRHPPEAAPNCIPLAGDVTKANLGLESVPSGIDAIYHLAAVHRLSDSNPEEIWLTNVDGTQNVIDLCLKHGIPKLYFCSTAYTQGRNPYERSKSLCDQMVMESGIPEVVIFKPSIIMGTKGNFYPGHFSQFIALLIKIHKRAELIRRGVEGTLRLPVVEPAFRISGNPDSKLNLITVDSVVDNIVRIRKPGTFWLTNPAPPTTSELASWVGEVIMVDLRFVRGAFKPTPIESQFIRLVAAFKPYLEGDDLPSNLKHCQPEVDKKFIKWTVLNTLGRMSGLGEV